MKPKKFMLMITSVLMVVAFMMLQPILAWFYQYRTDFLVITGDLEISVVGKYQVATDASSLEYLSFMDDSQLNEFNFKDVSMDNFIAFKFEVTNVQKKDVALSMRLSDFTDCIFDHFSEYYDVKEGGGTISAALHEKIAATAELNTAKLTTIIDGIYYIDVDGSKREVTVENPYTWKYGYGEKIFEGINLPGEVTDLVTGLPKQSSVELYFLIRSDQRTGSTDEYKKWLCGYEDGDEHIAGYGQQRLANMLGWASWEYVPAADQAIIDDYLADFVQSELTSISTIDPVEGLAIVRLNLKYFEFIGENIRAHD